MASVKVDPKRRFKLEAGLGEVLDAAIASQMDRQVERIKAEVAAREISDATRHVFVAFGWLLSAAAADPRLVEIAAEAPAAPAIASDGVRVINVSYDGPVAELAQAVESAKKHGKMQP
jgi:predicted methyltransferase